ncbi:uncharacterized protein RCO7_00465 [Rhynchosporium graminicola]|uniref:Uncharacterized protein n=1 Tax=Rhynchosporium graminicola TaxID=2792576 RepID=A0A1E1KMC1_9HELO|nr:uncharacterized protein RCO7_00465 [Rhynchosporium commune]
MPVLSPQSEIKTRSRKGVSGTRAGSEILVPSSQITSVVPRVILATLSHMDYEPFLIIQDSEEDVPLMRGDAGGPQSKLNHSLNPVGDGMVELELGALLGPPKWLVIAARALDPSIAPLFSSTDVWQMDSRRLWRLSGCSGSIREEPRLL